MSSLHRVASYKKRRLYPKQDGFGLLFFVVILGTIALNLLMGTMSSVIRDDHQLQTKNQKKALESLVSNMEVYYNSNLASIDSSSLTTAAVKAEAAEFLPLATVSRVQYFASEPLTQNGITFRRWVFYVPSMTEESNPPAISTFQTTGVWQPCQDTSLECVEGAYVVFSSDQLHRVASIRAYQTLSKVVLKAQGFFKTRRIQDPQLSTVPNYFRTEANDCSFVHPDDLGCIDTYQPLATISGNVLTPTDTAKKLQLSENELLSPWGTVLELSNMQDSEYQSVPYSAAFRFKGPNNTYITMKAVQQF